LMTMDEIGVEEEDVRGVFEPHFSPL